MSIIWKEEFFQQYPNLFTGYTFKFEGLDPAVEQETTNFIKRLNGSISTHSPYVFCTTEYARNNLKDPINYYNYEYVLESISAKKPLNLENYRFRFEKSKSDVQEANDSCTDTNDNLQTSKRHSEDAEANESKKFKRTKKQSKLNFSKSDANHKEKDSEDLDEWWLHLSSRHKSDPNTTSISNTRKGKRGDTFSISEKKTMISYLVINDLIHRGKSGSKYSPWVWIRKEGYMRHRSDSAMRNNFRNVILPEIRTYGLPPDILEKFLNQVEKKDTKKI